MPYIGNQPGTGVRSRFIYTATASQTTFSGADDNSKTLKYSDADYIDVYLNGVCLVPVTDYTASTKTSVVLTQAASVSDTLEVVAYDIATISDTVSKADGGTFNGDLGITNASPDLTLTNNTTEDTDGGRESTVTFKGLQSGGEESTLAEIRASHDATADDQKGDLIFKTNDGSDGASPTEVLRTNSAGNLLITSSDQNGLTLNTTDSNGGFIALKTSGTAKGYIGTSHHLVSGGSPSEDDTTIRAEGKLQITAGGGTERARVDTAGITIDPQSAGGMFLSCDTSSSGDGHILLKRGTNNKYQIGTDTGDEFFIYNYGASQYSFVIATNGLPRFPTSYSTTTGTGANMYIQSNGAFYRSTSSRRYKNTIEDATHGLSDLLKLRSVTYKGNEDGDTVFGGLIAEEVHDAGLIEFVQYNDDNEPDALSYGNMVSLCVKAIQEQQTTITAQATKIETLEAQNTTQATQIADLITRVEALEAG